ncbi:hypothetical protein HMSSN036_02760 [Paenibacillus macerans]|nr:hypothetical protein HMSSN036_02760 [Paenibacillus macerans]
MAADQLKETTVSTDPVFSGKMISLQVDTVKLPDGTLATREVVKHPGAVAVLAVHEGRLLLVDQYRQAMGRCEMEIPAGKLEKGEDPLEAAARELQEETGYTCGKLTHLHSFYTSPGFADEIIHLYWAEELSAGEMARMLTNFSKSTRRRWRKRCSISPRAGSPMRRRFWPYISGSCGSLGKRRSAKSCGRKQKDCTPCLPICTFILAGPGGGSRSKSAAAAI